MTLSYIILYGIVGVTTMYDNVVDKIIQNNKNMMVPFYIMSAYAYYVKDEPIFTDEYFDNLSKNILKDWDEINHYHKYLLNKDTLIAGSYLGEYPSIIEGALESFINQRRKK